MSFKVSMLNYLTLPGIIATDSRGAPVDKRRLMYYGVGYLNDFYYLEEGNIISLKNNTGIDLEYDVLIFNGEDPSTITGIDLVNGTPTLHGSSNFIQYWILEYFYSTPGIWANGASLTLPSDRGGNMWIGKTMELERHFANDPQISIINNATEIVTEDGSVTRTQEFTDIKRVMTLSFQNYEDTDLVEFTRSAFKGRDMAVFGYFHEGSGTGNENYRRQLFSGLYRVADSLGINPNFAKMYSTTIKLEEH